MLPTAGMMHADRDGLVERRHALACGKRGA
jgi:hypothetical protein